MRIPVASAALLLALVMAIGPGAAAAHEPTVTEFQVGLSLSNGAWDIVGPRRQALVTESADPGRIGRITTDGVITENSIGLTPNMIPTDITAGPDGNLWFTENGTPGAIGRITPEGQITEFRDGLTSGSGPMGIAAGTDGALWFTETASPGRIGRITKHGDISEYVDGLTPDRSPWFITPGPGREHVVHRERQPGPDRAHQPAADREGQVRRGGRPDGEGAGQRTGHRVPLRVRADRGLREADRQRLGG